MLELLAFVVVGLALGAPFIVPLIWGHTQSSQASAPSAQDCRALSQRAAVRRTSPRERTEALARKPRDPIMVGATISTLQRTC